jgi:hypothetical protein
MQFKGSALNILTYNTFVILLLGTITSIGIMGPNWPFLFVASLVVMLPLVLAVTAALAWANRVSFDDERREFVKPGGRRIPYDRVRAISYAGRAGALDVYVKRGWMYTTSLVEAVPEEQGRLLRDELAKRFPDRMHPRGRWAAFVPAAAIIAVTLAAFGGFHLFLHHRYPQLNARLRTLERLERDQQRSLPPLEYAGAFGFTPPQGFRYIGEESGELYFEDRSKKQRLKVVSNIVRRIFDEQALLFRRAMGVADYGDLMTLTYRSRYGIIPLLLRATDLAGLEQAAIYEIGAPVRGFVKQGRQGREEVTHIVVIGAGPDQEVHFFFSGPARLAEKTLQTFLSGVRLIETPGGGTGGGPPA